MHAVLWEHLVKLFHITKPYDLLALSKVGKQNFGGVILFLQLVQYALKNLYKYMTQKNKANLQTYQKEICEH